MKKGNTVQFIAWKQEDQVQVAAILYSLPMTGGLHGNQFWPLYQEEAMLEPFYAALKDYAKENGAIELVIKPYDTYQTFDSDGNQPVKTKPISWIPLKNWAISMMV